MVEARGKLGFTEEPQAPTVVQPLVLQHLDNAWAAKWQLLTAIHGTIATGTDPFTEHEHPQRTARKITLCHGAERTPVAIIESCVRCILRHSQQPAAA
jgi:hypothetical protein